MTAITMLLAIHCGGPREGARSERPGLPFTVITGSGGGFTGLREGYVIDSAGEVNRWRGVLFDRSERTFVGRLSESQCQDLADVIVASGVLDTSSRGSGNITSFIALRSASVSREYSWQGIEPGREVPEAVRRVYEHIKTTVRSITNSP